MYNNAKHFRNSELETITNKYIDLHSGYGINEEIVKDLERKFYDKRNKPIVRNINNAIAEHNAHLHFHLLSFSLTIQQKDYTKSKQPSALTVLHSGNYEDRKS